MATKTTKTTTKAKEGDGAGLLTAANIAKELGVSDAKVKKAISELKLSPDAKKGVCSYYGPAAVKKIGAALK